MRSDWQINQISTTTRTEEMTVSETTTYSVSTSSNTGTQIAQIIVQNFLHGWQMGVCLLEQFIGM